MGRREGQAGAGHPAPPQGARPVRQHPASALSQRVAPGEVASEGWAALSLCPPRQRGHTRIRQTDGPLLPQRAPTEHIVKGCEIIVFRELVSGIYFGERTESTPDSDVPAEDKCTYSASEIRRIARLAGQMASVASPPLAVHSIDKANVLATSRLWRATVTQVFADEFPHIKLDHQLVDSAAMLLASNPRKLNGIVLSGWSPSRILLALSDTKS